MGFFQYGGFLVADMQIQRDIQPVRNAGERHSFEDTVADIGPEHYRDFE